MIYYISLVPPAAPNHVWHLSSGRAREHVGGATSAHANAAICRHAEIHGVRHQSAQYMG